MPQKMLADTLDEEPPVRLKRCKHGIFMYNMYDDYVGRSLDYYGEFSELECKMFNSIVKPGMLAIDVGANIGVHTVNLAKAVTSTGKVLAFEPQRILYQMLCGNAALNAPENVFPFWAAVGKEPGSINVPFVDYSVSNNFGGLQLVSHRLGEMVPVRTIDMINPSQCDFIKVDVEGMELEVLMGAEQTLNKHRPVLYVENDRTDKSEALIRYLLGLGYRLYWHIPILFSIDNYFGRNDNIFLHPTSQLPIASYNMLCVHPTSSFVPPTGGVEITAATAHRHPTTDI